MAGTLTDIANRALDAAGAENPIGDIEDGSREANILLRHTGPVLRQLLRAAYWDMARKQAPLLLLADASGNTPGVGTAVIAPWTYEYALPTDSMAIRFIPQNPSSIASPAPQGNIVPANSSLPLLGTQSQPPSNQMRLVPSRFLIATDSNYPPEITPGPGGTQWWEQQGISPNARTVILSNVQGAYAVYTCLQIYPSLWDPLFEAAYVAALAEVISVPLARDKEKGREFRKDNIAIATLKLKEARARDGNEGVSSTDHTPDWLQIRRGGGPWGGGLLGGGGPGALGILGEGFSAYAFSNGSAY